MVPVVSGPARATLEVDELRLLVHRAGQRDPAAWDQLYRRSYLNLYGFARRRLLDDRAAEDAVSETMARAIDHIDRFRWQGAGFDAWLYGIARNVVREFGRAGRRSAPPIEGDRPSVERGPEDDALAAVDTHAMRRAFSRLDPLERQLLELRVQHGLCADEVGRLLGKRAGAVRMAQVRALRKLRICFLEAQSDAGHGQPCRAVGRQDAGPVERLAGQQDLHVA